MTGSFIVTNNEELYNVNMEKKERKPNRLKNYDYSQNGAYFITICTKDREPILSQITVGDDVLGVPQIRLSQYGKIVDKTIMHLNNKKGIYVDNYVIMPNHLHLILSINNDGAPRTSHPTVSSFVGLLKRFVNKQIGHNIWQRSYYDHIIRDDIDYLTIYQYIDKNPIKWSEDKYYLYKVCNPL